MDKFSGNELADFLRAVDGELAEEMSVVIIGGAVIGLLYNPVRATSDIDLYTRAPPGFLDACERAKQSSGLHVEVSDRAGNVAHAPETFEERLEPYGSTEFQKLRVLLPERHDLAIMKVARGYANDLDGIADIHRVEPLQLEVLLARYRETYFVGADRVRLNFLAMVEQLFGEPVSDEVARKL